MGGSSAPLIRSSCWRSSWRCCSLWRFRFSLAAQVLCAAALCRARSAATCRS